MLKTSTCQSVACDVCDYELDEDDEGIVHFDDTMKALKYAADAGWWASSETAVLCQERDEEHWARALEIRTALDEFDVSTFDEWLPAHWRNRLEPTPPRAAAVMPGQTEIPAAGGAS